MKRIKRAPQTSQKGEQIGIKALYQNKTKGKLQRQGICKPVGHTPNMPELHLN